MKNSQFSTRKTDLTLDPASTSSSPPTPAPSPVPTSFYKSLYSSHSPGPSPLTLSEASNAELSGSDNNDFNNEHLLGHDLVPQKIQFDSNNNSSSIHNQHQEYIQHQHLPQRVQPDVMNKAKQMFTHLTDTDKAAYIQALLSGCGREVLASAQSFIEPLLKKDPFRMLPREISFVILSYIDDPLTLARASQVSRLWYLILSDDLTWKELCKSHHFRRLSAAVNRDHRMSMRLPSVSIDPSSMSQDDLAEAIYDPEATKKPVPRSYRSHFKNEYMLNSAWNSGGRLAARYVITNPGVVTALLMTNRYIVIALDNSKIFVFREDGKMLRSLFGHVMGVWALALMGDTLVSGGCDRDVRVWDLKTGNCLQILRGHSSTVRCLEMVDSKTAISGSRDTTLRVWDLERGVCKRVLQGHASSVRCMAVMGDICISGSYDFTARVWQISTGECLHTLAGHMSQIYCLAFDGDRVATGSLDASIRIWNVHTGECTGILQGHTSLVGQIQMKDNVLVSGGSDGAVRVWDLNSYTCVHRFAAHDNSVTSLQFDDNRVVSGGSDGQVRVWDMNTGQHIRDLSGHFDAVWRVAFRDEKVAILASKANHIYMELTSFTPPKELVETTDAEAPPAPPAIEFNRTSFSNHSPGNTDDEDIAPNETSPSSAAATAKYEQDNISPPAVSVDPNQMDLSG